MARPLRLAYSAVQGRSLVGVENRLRCSKTRRARRTSTCPLCRALVTAGQQVGYVPVIAQWCHVACLLPRKIETLNPL